MHHGDDHFSIGVFYHDEVHVCVISRSHSTRYISLYSIDRDACSVLCGKFRAVGAPRGSRRADVRETCGCTRRRCAALPRSDRPGQLHDHVAGCSQVVRAARTRAASACSFPSSRPPNILRCKEAEISLHRPFNARAENESDRFVWAVPAPIHHSVSDEASVAALARYVSCQHSISVHCVVHCHCLSVNRSSPGIFLAFFSSPLR